MPSPMPVEDWLCAASSALMVSGEICDTAAAGPGPEPTEACEFDDGQIERALAFWLKPVDCADDDFDDVSALRASMADDAAPKGKQHGRTPTTPRRSRPIAHAYSSASAVP